MTVRTIKKQLIVAEDVALGAGKVTQQRGQQNLELNKLALAVGLASREAVATVNPTVVPVASFGTADFVAVNGQYQEAVNLRPFKYVAGYVLTEADPHVLFASKILKRLTVPYTLTGLVATDGLEPIDLANWEIVMAGASEGFAPVAGSFLTGGRLDYPTDVLQSSESPVGYFSWGGSFPKIVPPGSTIASTGGESITAWTNRNDATLAAALANGTGGSLVGFKNEGSNATARTVQKRLKDTVNLLDYYDESETNPVNAAFARAFAYGNTVEVTQGINFSGISGEIVIPNNKDVALYGNLTGGASARFSMQGTGEFYTKGGLLNNIYLRLLGGSPKVTGFRATGRANTAAILIQGTGTYKNVLIQDIDIYEANYGILRQGSTSAINGCQVLDGMFSDLKGDAIEWNVSNSDKNIQVINHIIDLVDSTGVASPLNWGIGVGFAGTGYDNTYPENKCVKDFVIAKITGSRMRQLIHVEMGKRFTISEITGHDITTDYSTTSGLENRSVVTYGCTDFDVDTIKTTSSAGKRSGSVVLDYGYIGGAVVCPSQNYKIKNINLQTGSVILNTGNSGAYAYAEDVNIQSGVFEVNERPSDLRIKNIKAKREKSQGKAVLLRLDLNIDGRQAFRAGWPNNLEIIDCTGLDENYADSCDVSGIVQSRVTLKGNNFDAVALSGPSLFQVSREVNRTFSGASNGVPYGREFVKYDMFIDRSTGDKYMFTGAGSLNRTGDTFEVIDATNRLIQQTGGTPWGNAFTHEAGQRIILPGCGVSGADLTTTVKRTFVSGGQYRMEVSDAISAANGTTGTTAAAVVATYVMV